MSERLTVTIPDGLYERLQKVKSHLNISSACAACIEHVVVIEELKKSDKNMDNALTRLRIEKKEFEKAFTIDAFKDGQNDALELSYEEFLEIEADSLSKSLMKWIDNRRILNIENLSGEKEELYIKGWKEGVLNIWNNLKTEL